MDRVSTKITEFDYWEVALKRSNFWVELFCKDPTENKLYYIDPTKHVIRPKNDKWLKDILAAWGYDDIPNENLTVMAHTLARFQFIDSFHHKLPGVTHATTDS